MRVAIIGGTGKMGRWFANFLSKDGQEVVITGRNAEKLKQISRETGAEAAETIRSAVKGAKVIMLSVPIDDFESIVKQLQPHTEAGQIVVDLTSVKTAPVEAMHKHLPNCAILGAHPIFGPGAKSLQDQNVVLTPTNEKEAALAEKVKTFLDERGARVAVMTPDKHDEMIAVILGFAHFVAIASADALLSIDGLREMAHIAGPTFKLLFTLTESVLTEDPGLYASIQMNLPRMAEIEGMFVKSAARWTETVKNKDKNAFVRDMTELKSKMGRNNPEFGKSYEAMYKILSELKM